MNMKQNKNNNMVLQSIIVVLLIIVAILAFFLAKNNNSETTSQNTNSWTVVAGEIAEDLTIVAIDDKRCSECFTNEIVEQLKNVPNLANAKFEVKDFSDSWVSDMLKENNIGTLPAIIFSHNNVDPQLAEFLVQLGSGEYSLNVGAQFNPFAEICDNGVDDTNNGQIDCADSTCAGSLLCREEIKGNLDVFLMGYCPYGEIAAKALPAVKEALQDGVNVDIHFIATKTGEWDTAEAFQSLHGVPEAEENIRQLCIKKYYGVETLIDYFQTRYENANNYGQVTDKPELAYEANGIDTDKINSCVENGEWGKLLEEDVKIAQGLGIGASPTWLANNKYQFGGINASDIQANFCKYNSDVAGCDTIIESTTPSAAGDPSCN